MLAAIGRRASSLLRSRAPVGQCPRHARPRTLQGVLVPPTGRPRSGPRGRNRSRQALGGNDELAVVVVGERRAAAAAVAVADPDGCRISAGPCRQGPPDRKSARAGGPAFQGAFSPIWPVERGNVFGAGPPT